MKIYQLERIETPRLILRPVQLGDEFELNKAVHNTLAQLQRFEPWAKDPRIQVTREFIQKGVFAWESQSQTHFPMVVVLKEGNVVIGATGFNERSQPKHDRYEVGYWLDARYHGQGLATEYVNALCHFAFEELNARQVVILTHPENQKSINVAKRLNFTFRNTDPIAKSNHTPDTEYVCEAVQALPEQPLRYVYKKKEKHSTAYIDWAREALAHPIGFDNALMLAKTPWSEVIELRIPSGPLYLKKTSPDLFIEAGVLEFLHAHSSNVHIPKLKKTNRVLNTFIMEKCGDITLREHFKQGFDFELLKTGLNNYQALQLKSKDHINALISLGVPDWRLDRFSNLYQELIRDTLFLQFIDVSCINKKLRALVKPIEAASKSLEDYDIPYTLDHCDFHDNNLLLDLKTQNISIIDLGESVITHPLFSVSYCLNHVQRRNEHQEHQAKFTQLRESRVAFWIKDKEKQVALLHLIERLLPLYALLSLIRLIHSVPEGKREHLQYLKSRVQYNVEQLILNMEAT